MTDPLTRKQKVLEDYCRQLGRAFGEELSRSFPSVRFVLVLADTEDPINAYTANVKREDGIRILRELTERLQ